MLVITQLNTEIIKNFDNIRPGMQLDCHYKLGIKKDSPQSDGDISFIGPVIQKTTRLFAVRDRNSHLVYCLSLKDCLCGCGKYRIIMK